MATEWQEWAEATSKRQGWAEQRIQSLQDLSIQWSTWAFKINDRMECLESRMLDLETEMRRHGQELQQHRKILLALTSHFDIDTSGLGLDTP